MGIFYRRPLCALALIYILASLLCIMISSNTKLYLALFGSLLFLMSSVLCVIIRNFRPQVIFISLAAILFCIAVCLSYFSIDAKAVEARKYTGKRYAYMTVISSDDLLESKDSYSAYEVIIDGTRDEALNISATALCFFETELFAGDKVYAFCELFEPDDCPYTFFGELDINDDCRLIAVIYDAEDAVSNTSAQEPSFLELFKKDHAPLLISNSIRSAVKERIADTLGDSAPLAQGVLTGDKSEMNVELVRNFKHSGVSHVLAVSGLHVTLLLGAIEMLLRRFSIAKATRCVIISVISFGLLVITGFSMSAMRAVFMLLLTYLFYAASEEPDSLTSLFCAAALILIISPTSVTSLSLWMSFFATLGIITFYSYLSPKLRKSTKSGIGVKVKNLLVDTLRAILLSVIATLFIIPFSCLFFGEMSIVFIPVNLILSLIIPVFLCGIPISLAVADIPVIGKAICEITELIGKLLIKVINLFAESDFSTLSLRYAFVKPILIIFVITLCIGLTLKFKRKWVALIAPSACVIAFAIGVVLFHTLGFSNETGFYSDGKNEIIYSVNDGSLTVTDISDGAYSPYKAVITEASRLGSTSIDSLILTHIDESHAFSIDYVLRSNFVKTLYIPKINQNAEAALSLAKTAKLCGTEVVLYESEEIIEFSGGRFAFAECEESENIVFAFSGKHNLIYLESANCYKKYESALDEFDTVIFGIHGGLPSEKINVEAVSDKEFFISSAELSKALVGIDASDVSVSDSYPFKRLIKSKFFAR